MKAREAAKQSPHLEGNFKVVGVEPGPVRTYKHGEVDLRSISLDLAEQLHTEGFPYLKKIVKRTSSKKT